MRDELFARWLEQRYPSAVAATRLSNARRVEAALGDLDKAYLHDGMADVVDRLTYSRADEAAGRQDQSGIDIDGSVYNGLATLKSAAKLYRDLCSVADSAGGVNTTDFAVTVRPLDAEAGGGFVALVPELPGCMADGETPQEALTNAYDAIACWIDGAIELGRAVPEPRRAAA